MLGMCVCARAREREREAGERERELIACAHAEPGNVAVRFAALEVKAHSASGTSFTKTAYVDRLWFH